MVKTFKKGLLMALSFAFLGGLASCGPTDSTSSTPPESTPPTTETDLPSQSESSEEETSDSSSSSSSKEELKIESVSITNKDTVKNILVEEGATVTAEAMPSSIPQEFTYASSNEEIITVDAMGRITAIAPGTATLTVSCSYGGVTKSDTVEITVTNTFFSHSPVGMELADFTHELDETNPYVVYGGGGFMFFRNCFGTTWYAETDITIDEFAVGELFAKVGLMGTDFHDQNGLYYFFDCPLGDNNVLIDNWKAVGVNDRINGSYDIGQFNWNLVHTLTAEEMGITDGEPCLRYGDKFNMGLLRDGAYFHFYFNHYYVYSVKSTLLDPSIPTYPCFTANNVTATLSNYSFLEEGDPKLDELLATANAVTSPKTITIDKGSEATMSIDEEGYRVRATVASATTNNCVETGVTWDSSDKTVATIDDRGYITPLKAGDTTITATSAYPYSEAKATLLLHVVEGAVASEIQAPATLSVHDTETKALNASVLPAGADSRLTYTSADPSIAKVDAEGNVTGEKVGTTTITIASVQVPSLKKTVEVTVSESLISYQVPSYCPKGDIPNLDYSHMDDAEDPYVKVSMAKPDGFEGGAYFALNRSGTKWMTTFSFENVSFYHGEVWGKLFISANTADGKAGSFFFVDAVLQDWTKGGWTDIGWANWIGTTADTYTVGASFKDGQGVIPAGWRNVENVPSGGSAKSPVFGLIRDGVDYYFMIDGEIVFHRQMNNVAADVASVPVIGGFQAAMEIHDLSYTDDAATIDGLVAEFNA